MARFLSSPAKLLRGLLPAMLAVAVLASTVLGGAAAQVGPSVRYETLRQVRAGLRTDPAIVERIGGGTVRIVFADGAAGLERAPVLDWIKGSAETVSHYFGRFPVTSVSILVVAQDGDRVGHATTWGYDGSTIRIGVGRSAGTSAFARDWVLVHEMTHLALPNLPDNQVWALEGSATYIEPIARAQRGKLTAVQVWIGMAQGLPNGLPKAGDRGLDHTPTWGRTYWGGALFYLLADVRIRRATGNLKGMQDAFRAINRASGGNGSEWTMDRVVATGDAATGTDVLTRLYAEMRDDPVPVELDGLFAELGVHNSGGAVTFDDRAPESAIRRAITAPDR